VVHVLPLRALVQQQYQFLRRILGDGAGYLAGLRLSEKDYSGFMLRRAVVSTLDSFALNIARLPVAELAGVLRGVFEGHYELPRAAIASSLVVLDEAHLYAEPWASEEPISRWFFSFVLEVLARARIPLVVETATMSGRLIEEVARLSRARIVAVCGSCGGAGWSTVRDREYEALYSFAWETVVARDAGEALKRALDIAETGRKVLFAVNTVGSALRVYEEARSVLGDDVVLVHGRLSHGDKEDAVKRIEEARFIVSTQVIEAGVDVDAEVLFTEAAAPSSLAQRAGRLCRSKETAEKCANEKPLVVVYKPRSPYPYTSSVVKGVLSRLKSLLEGGSGVEWRLLDDRVVDGGRLTSFRLLVEELENQGLQGASGRRAAYRALLYHSVARTMGDPRYSMRLLEEYCSLVRGSALAGLAIPLRSEGAEPGAAVAGDEYDFVEVSLDTLRYFRERGRRVVYCEEDSCRVLAYGYTDEPAWAVVRLPRRSVEEMLGGCKGYVGVRAKLLQRASKESGVRVVELYPIVYPGAYVKGLGLIGA
jgi:CRISPR-associated endonuclease/helicase Cas3